MATIPPIIMINIYDNEDMYAFVFISFLFFVMVIAIIAKYQAINMLQEEGEEKYTYFVTYQIFESECKEFFNSFTQKVKKVINDIYNHCSSVFNKIVKRL